VKTIEGHDLVEMNNTTLTSPMVRADFGSKTNRALWLDFGHFSAWP